ncbi:MAG: hypothetical protein IJW14_00940 [Oscillospiraceae bacterium]|nr:hypothetical protein [Oscillospiraceae bacterium]
MKNVILIMTMICLLCLTACQKVKPTATNPSSSNPSHAIALDDFDPALWNEYSDYELIEMTLESPENEFRHFSAVRMTGGEWKDYMLENCDPFRALMLRDTAEESLKQHSFELVTNCSNAFTAENFAELVVAVVPEMKEELHEYLSSAGTESEIPVS